MQVNIAKSDLSKAMKLASKAVAPKPVIPLFSNVMFESVNSHTSISATNFEIGVSISIPSDGKPFKVAIPADTFSNLISAMQSEQVFMILNPSNQEMSIITPKSKSNVKCVSADDFPSIPSVDEHGENLIKLSSTEFKKIVERVAFCASRASEGKNTEGVLLSVENGKLIVFSTDGLHLSYEEIACATTASEPVSAIIRAPTLETIARLLDTDTTLVVQIIGNQIRFGCGELDVVCQTMDGKFPDYRLIAKSLEDPTTKVTISTLDLLRSCKHLEIFAADNGNSKFDVQSLLVTHSILSQDKGDASVTMMASVEGIPITIGINVMFLREFLEICDTPEIVIHMTSPKAPIIFYMKAPLENRSFYHIIMPTNYQ